MIAHTLNEVLSINTGTQKFRCLGQRRRSIILRNVFGYLEYPVRVHHSDNIRNARRRQLFRAEGGTSVQKAYRVTHRPITEFGDKLNPVGGYVYSLGIGDLRQP